MNSLLRLFAILRKEIRQLRRDRLTFGMIVGIPLLQITLFGYAINTDVRYLSAGVADQANTQLSRILVLDAQASQVVDIIRWVETPEELETLLWRGEISVGIFIPSDFAQRLAMRDRPAAQLMIDGADPLILAAARQLTGMSLRYDTAPRPSADAALFEIRNYYNPERRSAVYIVPGLMGVILTMTMVLFTSVAVVRERERGNLELLITTPVKNLELMVGKIIPYIVIGLIQVSLILLLGVLLFHVPIHGRIRDVYIASLVFIAANLTMGLVISTLAKTQFQAMQTTFFFFLPSILLSGFMFPFDGMPRAAQYIAELLPLTHFVRLIRGIMLRGAGLWEMAPEIRALLAFTLVTLSAAMLRFKKRLD
ncbi:ABC transporter permease [Methylocaldum szegediense]|uniref:ABC-2 type transport system permease protein n=1 Tax=Methylocaldum szegediense TaxID=73780 RepID=A0ABN8X2R4_9GAMM|nr:ABC transporter permease [Methylocaldum szegediense]CAI8782080.1 ABC-2 type transport system permease protein [Methylocaldum szegediense]